MSLRDLELDDTDDLLEILEALDEMSREKYSCEAIDYCPEDNQHLVVWTDKYGLQHGCWFSPRLLEKIFTTEAPN